MSFELFQIGVDNGYIEAPNDYYRNLQQAFIDSEWENTSTRITIEEQDKFGPLTFHKTEAWINRGIGQATTFMKNGEDFRQLVFKDIDKKCERGWMYRFEDNYWIVDFTSPSQGLVKDNIVRRCNNWLRIVDPENGSIFSYPCVIDYDMTSPSIQVNSNIITPNNHAIVIIQANKDTMRLCKLNTRYMLGGRPFKLYSFQNALHKNLSWDSEPNVLYLDLYLDEEHAKDDKVNDVADNGDFNYAVKIESDNLIVTEGSTGQLNASITLNGAEVNREIVWASSDNNIVSIDYNGNYEVVGKNGESCNIIAKLNGNDKVYSTIEIQIVEQEQVAPKIIINPAFDKIRQFESIVFDIEVSYNGQTIYPPIEEVEASLAKDNIVMSTDYLTLKKSGSSFILYCVKISPTFESIYIKVKSIDPEFEAEIEQKITCVSMMG